MLNNFCDGSEQPEFVLELVGRQAEILHEEVVELGRELQFELIEVGLRLGHTCFVEVGWQIQNVNCLAKSLQIHYYITIIRCGKHTQTR